MMIVATETSPELHWPHESIEAYRRAEGEDLMILARGETGVLI